MKHLACDPLSRTGDFRRLVAVLSFCLAAATLGANPAAAQPDPLGLGHSWSHFWVQGRVFGGVELLTGESRDDFPRPRQIDVDDVIVGADNLYPVEPRNLVRVSLIGTGFGAIEFMTLHDGAFLIHFWGPRRAATVSFQVHDVLGEELLLASDPVELEAGDSTLHLLVPGLAGYGGDVEHAPGTRNAVFTSVGLVPESSIVGGLADVAPGTASELRIPEYRDAPFGGDLRLFGAFSEDVWSNPERHCYEVRIDGVLYDRPLHKVRTVIDAGGVKSAEMVQVGPHAVTGSGGCYELTPLADTGAAGEEVFWYHPDLLVLWPTGGLEGEKTVRVSLYSLTYPLAYNWSAIDELLAETELTLMLSNSKPTVRFDAITAGGVDLLESECDPVDLSAGGELAIRFTASHPYLRSYHLRRLHNFEGGATGANWASDSYEGTNISTPLGGELFNTSDFPRTCAYILRLSARNRTTNGYHYIRWDWVERAYYVLMP